MLMAATIKAKHRPNSRIISHIMIDIGSFCEIIVTQQIVINNCNISLTEGVLNLYFISQDLYRLIWNSRHDVIQLTKMAAAYISSVSLI